MRCRKRINWSMYHAFYDGGVIAPPDPSELLQRLIGLKDDGFTVQDRISPLVATEPEAVDSYCVTTDGVGDSGSVSSSMGVTGYPFRIRNRVSFTSASFALSAGLYGVGSQQFAIGINAGKIVIVHRNTTTYVVTSPLAYNDASWNCVEGRFISATNRELWIGDTWDTLAKVAENTTDSTPFFTPTTAAVCSKFDGGSTGNFYAGSLADISFYSDAGTTLSGHFRLAEGAGLFANDTVSGLVMPFTTTTTDDTTLWVNRQDVYHANLADGFTPDYTDIDVIIFAGQSNCVGTAQETIPEKWDFLQEHRFGASWSTTQLFVLDYLQKFTDLRYGGDLQAGIRLSAEGRRVCFIKVAEGGSTLAVDWQKGAPAALYETLQDQVVDTLAALIADGYAPIIRQFWWMQGENDALDATYSANYQANFDTFWADMLADGVIDLGVELVIPQISVPLYTYRDEVRAAEVAIAADKGGYTFDTASYDLFSDNVHYSADGLESLGNDFADYYISKEYPIQGDLPGDDILLNGDFALGASDWTLFGEADLTGGNARILSTAGATSAIISDAAGQTIVTGHNYLITYDVIDNSGGALVTNIGGLVWPTTVGHHEVIQISPAPYVSFKRQAGITDITIDNITVQSALVGTLRQMIPALEDGSLTVVNGPISNHGCLNKYAVHNAAESGILQTDAQLLDNLFYSADGITFDAKYIADYRAAKQWEFNNLFQWLLVNGICMPKEVSTYPQAYVPSPADYLQGIRYTQRFTSSCGGGALVPAEVTAGTGIGPNGAWADNGAGGVLLVEDA